MSRCQAIEGAGPITAAALTMAFHRGKFRGGDAFVALLGLDVRGRDSGTMTGRRRLTKQGDPELRRLLYLAAMTASRNAAWALVYQRYLARGFTRIQALTILARKLARVAFAFTEKPIGISTQICVNLWRVDIESPTGGAPAPLAD